MKITEIIELLSTLSIRPSSQDEINYKMALSALEELAVASVPVFAPVPSIDTIDPLPVIDEPKQEIDQTKLIADLKDAVMEALHQVVAEAHDKVTQVAQAVADSPAPEVVTQQ